jgi:dihydrolipoamide dehydrogenase
MAEQQNFDVVIIGGGPGGYSAAIRAAQLGRRVALVEKEENLGGVCLNWGCIPTKALLKQAEIYCLIQRADEFGFKVGPVGVDWQKMIGRSRQVSQDLAQGVAYLMQKNKVTVFTGHGRLTPARKVEVQGDGRSAYLLSAEQVILATGSRPVSLPGIEIDGVGIITSKEAMTLEKQPKSLAIIGAGAIGVEFAYFYNAFGTKVTLLEAQPQVLPREDEEVAALLAEELGGQGVQVETGVRVEAVEKKGRQMTVRYKGAKGEILVKVDKVLMAVGVVGNSKGLGLEALGIRSAKGAIEVNGRLETSVKGIYAIGDVAGPPQLAHVAAAEGVAAVEFGAGKERPEINRSHIPSCVYCQPQVASLGLSEKEARAAGYEVKVGRFPFAASGKARAAGDTSGMVKLVFESKYGEFLGASIIGAEATELIAELGLARNLEATYEEILQTVHAHPTLSEAVMEAAGAAFGEALNI